MNVLNKVTLQSLKKNKTRTVVTIIGIILSAAMICAVTTFASSCLNYARETVIYSQGNWHGSQKDTGLQTYEAIRDSGEVEEAVYLQQLGYAYAQGCENQFKPYIYVLGAGGGVENVLPIHITSGRYPASPTELLLPEHLYSNGNVKHALGDILTLELGERVLDGYTLTQDSPCYIYEQGDEVWNGETLEPRETRSYTVVGFYERLNYDLESAISPGYTAITLADQPLSHGYEYDVYFRMADPGQTYSFMWAQALEGIVNTDLLMYSGTFALNGLSSLLYSLAAIVILLIMFGSVALIYNAFSISVSDRTKQFGLLSSVGATRRQLRRMVLTEAMMVSLIGIPLGILAGVGGIGITLMIIGDKFRSIGFPLDMHLSVSPAAIVTAVIVAVITVLISAWIPSRRATRVSAVEAIRLNRDVAAKPGEVRTLGLSYKLFGLPGMLAKKYYKRSRKKYRATVLSLFMSVVLFVSASAFTDYLMEVASNGFASVGYDLSIYVQEDELEELSPGALLEAMKSKTAVTGGAYIHERYVNTQLRSADLTQEGMDFIRNNFGESEDPQVFQTQAIITFVDDEAFRALLEQEGLDPRQFFDPGNPLGVALDGSTSINLRTQKFETVTFYQDDRFQVTSRKEKVIPGYTCAGEGSDPQGHSALVYIPLDGPKTEEARLYIPPEEGYVDTQLNIGAVVTRKAYFVRDTYGVRFVYPMSQAEQVFSDIAAEERSFYFMLTSSAHAESYKAVEKLLEEHGLNGKDLMNYAQEEESERNIVTIIRVFSYGFIVLISLIAAANVFNTVSTNIGLRRRDFAMLRSAGMSAGGMRRMMGYECLLYGSRALLYGLPAACGVTYLIYGAIMEGYETTFRLPWKALAIASFSVFLVVGATMMYAIHKVKKDNPIDALRNENL